MDIMKKRRCVKCGKDTVVKAIIVHHTKIGDLEIIIPEVPVRECSCCGEVYFGNKSDKVIAKAVKRYKTGV